MKVSKLSRRIGGLTAAIVLGITGISVLTTPSQAAASFSANITSPYLVQLATGYTEPATATVDVTNNGDTAGDPACVWSSATGTSSTLDATNVFPITTACPSSLAAGKTATAKVTIPTGLAAGTHYLKLSIGGSSYSSTVLNVTVTDPTLSGVTISAYIGGSLTSASKAPVGTSLSASLHDASPYNDVTYQWYCGDKAIADQNESSYQPSSTDISCDPGVSVKATVAAALSTAKSKQSDPVLIVQGDQIDLRAQSFDWNLLPGYTSEDQIKTATLNNMGKTDIDLSTVKCAFQADDSNPMDGTVALASTKGTLAPGGSLDVTLTAKPGLPVGTDQTGRVVCTTDNFGSESLPTNITVKKASLTGVSIVDSEDNTTLTQVSAGTELAAQPSDDAYPSDGIAYQWYCGSQKLAGATYSSYIPQIANVQCDPGISVRATVAPGTSGVVTKSSSPVKVIYGDYFGASSNSASWSLLTGYDATKQSQVVKLENSGLDDITSDITCAFQTGSYYTMKGTATVEKHAAIAPGSTVTVTITPEGKLPAGTDQRGQVVCSTDRGSITIGTSIVVSDTPVMGQVYIYDTSGSSVNGLNSETGEYDIDLAQVGDSVSANMFEVVPSGADISWKWFCSTKELGEGSVSSGRLSSTYVVRPGDVGCELSAQAFMTVSGKDYSSDPSSTITVAALSLTSGGDDYPDYPYSPRWVLYAGYDASKLNPGSLVLTNWGTTAVSDLTCSLPDDAMFSVVTEPASSVDPTKATVMQLKPKDGLSVVDPSASRASSQQVVCVDKKDGLQLSATASAPVYGAPVVTSTLSGTPQVGETVKAETLTLIPADADLTYKWMCQKSDGTTPDAPNNTSTATYEVKANDIGCNLFVTITASDGTATSSDASSTYLVSTVSMSDTDDWYVTPGYTASDLKPESQQVTITNNGKETLTNVSYACSAKTTLSAKSTGLKCILPSAKTLAPGQSVTATLTPQLGLEAGIYSWELSTTYTEKGRPVTVSDGFSITVDGSTPIQWIEPTNGVKTPVQSSTGGNGGTGDNGTGTGGTGGNGGTGTGDNGTGNGGSGTGTGGTGTGGTGTGGTGTGGTGDNGTGNGGTGTSATGGAGATGGGTVVAPSANGTTPSGVDTGGTLSHGSTGIALLGLGLIALGAVILKRRTA